MTDLNFQPIKLKWHLPDATNYVSVFVPVLIICRTGITVSVFRPDDIL